MRKQRLHCQSKEHNTTVQQYKNAKYKEYKKYKNETKNTKKNKNAKYKEYKKYKKYKKSKQKGCTFEKQNLPKEKSISKYQGHMMQIV